MSTFRMIGPDVRLAEELDARGYYVADGAVGHDDLERLRALCDASTAETEDRMNRSEVDVQGTNQRGRRYFINGVYSRSTWLREQVLGEWYIDVCRRTLGPDAYLLLEQFAVKAPATGTAFDWHQDSGYMQYGQGIPHERFINCWCALDDTNENNGALHVLPYGTVYHGEVLPHLEKPGSFDFVGYDGPEAGIPLYVSAGTIVVFTSTLLHRSGPNRSNLPRRAYSVQFSSHVFQLHDGQVFGEAVPILVGGKGVGTVA